MSFVTASKIIDDAPMDPERVNDSSASVATADQSNRLQSADIHTSEAVADQFSNGERAIRIHLIAEKIFAPLDLVDLKNLRLVSHNWSIASSYETIQRRDSLSVHEFHLENENADHAQLQKLVHLLNSRHSIISPTDNFNSFPCTQFKVSGHLDSPQLLKFFKLHGQNIKSLELFHTGNKNLEKTTIPRLLQLTPNVSKLSLRSSDFLIESDYPPSSGSSELFFPCLRTFAGGCYPHNKNGGSTTFSTQGGPSRTLAHIIFDGSPNLEEIQNFEMYNLDFFEAVQKIHLVKHVMTPSPAHLAVFSKFINLSPRLQKFSISYNDSIILKTETGQLCEGLTKLLECSKNSLQTLSWQPLKIFEEVLLPDQMTALEKLHVDGHNKLIQVYNKNSQRMENLRSGRLFPIGLNVAVTFPNLKSLILDLGDFSQKSMENYFLAQNETALTGKFLSVQKLEIGITRGHCMSQFALEWLAKFCPKVDTLKICLDCRKFEGTEVPEIFRIWQGPQLHRLEFHVSGHCDREFLMDSILTGMDKGVCAKLRAGSLPPGGGRQNHIKEADNFGQEFRIRPGICEMTGLKIFKLQKWKGSSTELVSKVSHLYAFDLMPGLVVTIV